MTKQVEQWIEFAKNDIASATRLNDDSTLTQNAAFHCQQAVEKLFKALLEYDRQRVPKLHNLEVLYEKCTMNQLLGIDETILKEINEVYIDTRYPSDVGLIPSGKPSIDLINKFIEFAKDLERQIYTIIK